MRQASCRLVHRAAAIGFVRCPPGRNPSTSSCFDAMGLRALYQVLVRCMASSADRDGGGKSNIKRARDKKDPRGEPYGNKGGVGSVPRKHGGASTKEMQIDEEVSSHRGNLEGLLNVAAKHAHEMTLESTGRLLHSLAVLADAHSAPLSQAEAIRSDRRFEQLISCTHRRLDEEQGRPAKVQSVANVLKSYAWLKYDSDPALTHKVLDRWLVAIKGYPGSDAGAFTRLIQPLTNLKYQPGPDFWSRFNEEWLRFGVHKFRIRDLAAILHAYTHFVGAPLPKGLLSSVKAALDKQPLLDTGPKSSNRAEDAEKLPMLIHSLASMGTRLEAAEGKELRLPRIAAACVLAKAYAATRQFDQVSLAVVIYSLGQLVWPGLVRMGEERDGGEEEEFRYQHEHLEILGPLTRLMPSLATACRRAGLHSFSAQQLYMVFDGLTRVAYDPGREFIEELVTTYASQGDDVMYGKSVSVLLRGLANDFRHHATPAMVEDLAEIYVKQSFKEGLCPLHDDDMMEIPSINVTVLGSSDRARAIVALARMRYIPRRPFMDKFVDTCAKYKWKGWVVSELASMLDGLSALRIALPSETLPAFVTAFEDAYTAQPFRPQLLKYFGVLLRSLARLQQLDTLECLTLLQALTPSIVHNLSVMAGTEQARRHHNHEGGGGGGGVDGADRGSVRSSMSAGGRRGVRADSSKGVKHLTSCYTAAMCGRYTLAMEEGGKEAKGVMKELDGLIGALRAAGAECMVERQKSSAPVIEDMRRHLEAAGFRAESAHVVSEACVSMDLLLYPRDGSTEGGVHKCAGAATRPVVVELDVSENYVDMSSSAKVLSGDAALKQRVLELAVRRALIGAYVCVERQQWDKLAGQNDKKVQLVLDKLSKLGVDVELYRVLDTEE